jgi:hypothetical protein
MWTWKWSSAYPEYDIIAYAIAEQPEAEPQRIEWHGGECPVSAGTKVRVWLRDGQIFEGGASKYSSGYYGDDDWWTNHIIAYAIITPDWSDLGPKMAAALRFYADPANWTDPEQVNRDEMFDSPVNLDDHYGDRARAILAQIGETE